MSSSAKIARAIRGTADGAAMDFDIRPAGEADIPELSKLLLMATDGIVESLYEGLIPGLATHEIVEGRLAREDTCDSYANC